MAETLDVKDTRLHVVEFHQIERSQIARRVIDPEILSARVRSPLFPRRGARVPLIDGGVILHAGVGARPGGEGDLVPQVAGPQRLARPWLSALGGRLLPLGA